MIRSKYREYLILFLIFLGVGFIIHLAAFPDEAMMADGVLNEIWRASNKWECAQGRWLLPVLDMINHNLVISYVVTPVTIILTAVTALATLDIFKIYSKAAGFRKNPAVWLMGGV